MATLNHTPARVNLQREFKAQVLSALIRRGWRQQDLATQIGKGRTAVSQCLNSGKFPAVRAAISKALGLN